MLKIISAVSAVTVPTDATMVHLTNNQAGSSLVVDQNGRSLRYGLGSGDTVTVDHERYSAICRGIVAEAERLELLHIVLDLQEFLKIGTGSITNVVRTLAIDLQLASYKPGKHKNGGEKEYGGLSTVYVLSSEDNEARLEAGNQIGIGTNECRELVDEPSNFLFPMEFGERAKQLAASLPGVTVTVKEYGALKKEGYGLLCAVGQGAANKPCLIEVSYMGGDTLERPIAIVGKGITLDTGGTDLKLSGAIQGMQKDMGGGAAAIMAVIIAARLKLPVNVIAVVPAAENLVSSTCYRTCDVITGLDGRTVEVRNTDAEGRLVLSDGIVHAIREHDPSLLVTVATLTGAVRIALGNLHTGLFSSDKEFAGQMQEWGHESGNSVWHLPHQGYASYLESSIADIANVQANGGKDGGSAVAAAFLAEAAKPLNGIFSHLDIAGTAMEGSGKDGLYKGAATGVPVPLLVRMLEEFLTDV